MNRQQLEKYYDDRGLKPFHGCKVLDALRDLANDQCFHESVREGFQSQYDATLYGLGSSRWWDLTKHLYCNLNTKEVYVIKEVLKSADFDFYGHSYTLRILRIRVPYYEKVKEYYRGLKRSFKQDSEFDVWDLIHNGKSLFEETVKQEQDMEFQHFNVPSSSNDDTPWIRDRAQYAASVEGAFFKPYNGLSAHIIMKVALDFYKDRNPRNLRWQWGDDATDRTIGYLKKMVKNVSYYSGDDLAAEFTPYTKHELQEIDKKLQKEVEDLWGKPS